MTLFKDLNWFSVMRFQDEALKPGVIATIYLCKFVFSQKHYNEIKYLLRFM